MVRYSVLALVVACGPVKGIPPGGVPDAGPPGFSFAVLSTNVGVPLDGSAAIELAITRTGGFDGDLTVEPTTLPNGLEVALLTIPDGVDTAELVVGARSPFIIGNTVTFTIEATGTDVDTQSATITDALITGSPGSLDTAFGAGTGYAILSFGSDDNGAFEALEVVGGNIVATGNGTAGLGATRFTTTRLTANGAVDPTFNNGTLVRSSFGGSSNDTSETFGLGHQFDGRPIVIGHHAGSGLGADLAVTRLSTTGAGGGVDFANNGKSLIDLGGAERANDGLVLADGRILFTGDLDGHHLVALATTSGFIDTTFNTTGFVRDVVGDGSTANAVVLDASGRIVVAGSATTAGDTDLLLHRYTTAGAADTFGTAGRVTVAAAGNETPVGVVVLANGQIVVASATGGAAFRVRRFNDDGGADTTFGTGGLAEATATGTPTDFVVLPDGKLLVIGETATSAVLVRFKANGTIDPLFGTDGVVTVAFGDAAAVRSVVVYDSHQVVIAGGNAGGMPGPGTFGVLARIWM